MELRTLAVSPPADPVDGIDRDGVDSGIAISGAADASRHQRSFRGATARRIGVGSTDNVALRWN